MSLFRIVMYWNESLWFIYLVWNFDQWRPLRVRRCGSYIEFVTSVIRYFFLFIVAGVPLTASIISTGVICTFYTTLVRVQEVQSISFVCPFIYPSVYFLYPYNSTIFGINRDQLRKCSSKSRLSVYLEIQVREFNSQKEASEFAIGPGRIFKMYIFFSLLRRSSFGDVSESPGVRAERPEQEKK